MTRKVMTLTAPSHWASAIVNGDYSGLEPLDVKHLNTWLALQGLSFADCLSCEDADFMWKHDAAGVTGTGADCQTYTFLQEVQSC
jgi:hypothetical protein